MNELLRKATKEPTTVTPDEWQALLAHAAVIGSATITLATGIQTLISEFTEAITSTVKATK